MSTSQITLTSSKASPLKKLRSNSSSDLSDSSQLSDSNDDMSSKSSSFSASSSHSSHDSQSEESKSDSVHDKEKIALSLSIESNQDDDNLKLVQLSSDTKSHLTNEHLELVFFIDKHSQSQQHVHASLVKR